MCLDKLKSILDTIPDDIIMMSRKNCHANNIDSIVLGKNSENVLERMFIAHLNHRLNENRYPYKFPVGIHNHQYDIELRLFFGSVWNDIYVVNHDNEGFLLNQFSFKNDMINPPVISKLNRHTLDLVKSYQLSQHYSCSLKYSTYHNIFVESRTAAWFVKESSKVTDTTKLFTPLENISTEGLYGKFESREEVYESIERFFIDSNL